MITRKAYMNSRGKLHHAYHIQFATDKTRQIVLDQIGRERILDSKCEHFNDIPLELWDSLHARVKDSINQRLKGQAEGFEPGRFGYSLADTVCIAKAIAKEYKGLVG
jgi:hypothetical protein